MKICSWLFKFYNSVFLGTAFTEFGQRTDVCYAAVPIAGRLNCCSPSVCLSVSFRFSRNRKAVETSNLVQTALWRVTGSKFEVCWSKVKVTGYENVREIVSHTSGTYMYLR